MRKIILSICFILTVFSAFSQENETPYITVRESEERSPYSQPLEKILERLIDVSSYRQMTYWSEWRKKERILFEEAHILSITPPLAQKENKTILSPRYDFTLFLKDASFGDIEWKGNLIYSDNRIRMKMMNSTPLLTWGIEAAPADTLEIILDIEKKDSRLSVVCTGHVHNKIKAVSKARAEKSIRNRLIAFRHYISDF